MFRLVKKDRRSHGIFIVTHFYCWATKMFLLQSPFPTHSLCVFFLNCVKALNGINYEDWKESLGLYLTIYNLDLALRIKELGPFTHESSKAENISHDKWEHSNRVCLKVAKYTMEKSIRQSILKNDNAKDFLTVNGEKFMTFEKSISLSLFDKTKYDDVSGVFEHIMKMVHYYSTKGIKKFNHKGMFQYDKKKEGKVVQHLEPKKKFFKGNYKYCKECGHKMDDNSDVTIHVGFTSPRKPNDVMSKIILGDGAEVPFINIRAFTLCLPSGHTLLLRYVVYLPSIRRNTKYGYNFEFGCDKICCWFKSFVDGFYMLNVNNFVNSIVGSKHSRIDETSSMLWHRCLGYIFMPQTKGLMK
ncbi:hypothetical protein CR513_48475, partial [Mucuna pruriens]